MGDKAKTVAVELTEAECYRIYNWAQAELRRLQDQTVATGRPMADAQTMFPDAWRNNQAIFDKFFRLWRIHKGLKQPVNGFEIPMENATKELEKVVVRTVARFEKP